MTRVKSGARIGACVLAVSMAGMSVAQARGAACATASEVSAIQVAAVQQELTDSALEGTCTPRETELFNRFQTVFHKELMHSDAVLLSMFKRLHGARKGNDEYDAFKTRAIAHAEQRRTKPGAAADFCRTADLVFAAALAPDKPVLEDFVSGVPVSENSPVDTCEIKVALTLQGVQAGPDIVPIARPDLPGDPPNQNLFPN